MITKLESLAKDWQANGYPQITDRLNADAQEARRLGAPETFPSVATPESLEIPAVSEKLYVKTRKELEKQGLEFVVVNPESIDQLATNEEARSLFGYINRSEKMRSNIPPQIEVAIDPNHFRIEGSNRLSTDDQIEKIKHQEAMLKGKLPEDVKNLISMRMPEHASLLVQLDLEYQKRKRKALFTNWFGRTDDQTFLGLVAIVGRFDPTGRLLVDGWPRGIGSDFLFAVPVVVLPRKLAV